MTNKVVIILQNVPNLSDSWRTHQVSPRIEKFQVNSTKSREKLRLPINHWVKRFLDRKKISQQCNALIQLYKDCFCNCSSYLNKMCQKIQSVFRNNLLPVENDKLILRRSTSRRYNWPARRLNVAVKAGLDFKINLVELAEITLVFGFSSLRQIIMNLSIFGNSPLYTFFLATKV